METVTDRLEADDARPGASGWEQPSLSDSAGDWLADHKRWLDSGEAAWLEALADFDAYRGWACDGQTTCADWLMWRCGLARTTAYEKVRVAHELRRRPVLAEALAGGRASYCAVRTMVRATGASREVDEAFVAVAEAGTVTDVERAVAAYLLHASQHNPPDDRLSRRGLRVVPRGDGTCKVEAILTDEEAAELDAALGAHLERPERPERRQPVDEYARADSLAGPQDAPDWQTMRADALMSLVRAGMAGGHSPGSDRYLAHIIVEHDHGCLLGGQPLPDAAFQQIICDCSTVTHHVDPDGVPLALGRKSRTWTTAQRRAIIVRDGGHCRWPGCRRTHVDVHHRLPWDDGGGTDVDNGIALCARHHTAIHRNFYVTGSANSTLDFHRQDGSLIGSSPTGVHRWDQAKGSAKGSGGRPAAVAPPAGSSMSSAHPA